jgi:PleD family two-component response regulator
MPAMTNDSRERRRRSTEPVADRSILLASDSERHGNTIHRALQERGFAIEYAGDYSQVDAQLNARKYDVVLLEVTGQHAVEPAVAAALRVKRANAGQFVGYLADATLETSGLAGDAILPRNATRLPEELSRFMADGWSQEA